MNVLVMGSGGREHALSLKISESKHIEKLFVMPGNPGTSSFAQNVEINPLINRDVVDFCVDNKIDLVIPGSEIFLVNGISDDLAKEGIICFGPSKKATLIESSKTFAKELMRKNQIPTAAYEVFTDYRKAIEYIKQNSFPVVIKYDGLAAGKGVVIVKNLKEAENTLNLMLNEKIYGNPQVVIEEYLQGPEFSLMCFVDHNIVIPMPICQDHKRRFDGDEGPNTGGMGIYCPVPIISGEVIDWATQNIMKKIVDSLGKEGINYRGFLYGGLMQTNNGPYVIEFNARFGDPEAEVLMPKLKSDILEVISALNKKQKIELQWDDDFVLAVVMASKGYPGSYKKGYLINGDTSRQTYHMGTSLSSNHLYTNGGRVLCVYGKGKTLGEAKKEAYRIVNSINCENLVYRSDIGYQSLIDD